MNVSSAAHRGCRDAARLTSQQLTLNGNLPEGAAERFSQTDVTRLLGAYMQEKEAPKVNECSARRKKKKKKLLQLFHRDRHCTPSDASSIRFSQLPFAEIEEHLPHLSLLAHLLAIRYPRCVCGCLFHTGTQG